MSKPTQPINDIISRYRRLNPDNKGIVLGVSGGVDSVALAFCLSKVCKNLRLAHITHRGIRDNATLDKETELVRKLADSLSADFQHIEFEVDSEGNIEGNARYQRYQALTRLCYGPADIEGVNVGNPEYRILATAHHADDQLETLLMKLARGSSVSGMSGIREKMNIPYSHDSMLEVIRPMLGIVKEDCYDICRENNLEWLEDATNKETDKTRNLVRHKILPLMKELNPKVSEHATNFAGTMKSVGDLLDEEVLHLPGQEFWGNKVQTVSADALRLKPDVVIHAWLNCACYSIPRSGGIDVDKINRGMLDKVVEAVRKRKNVTFEWPLRYVEVTHAQVIVKAK